LYFAVREGKQFEMEVVVVVVVVESRGDVDGVTLPSTSGRRKM
jgi:hypothetical protein